MSPHRFFMTSNEDTPPRARGARETLRPGRRFISAALLLCTLALSACSTDNPASAPGPGNPPGGGADSLPLPPATTLRALGKARGRWMGNNTASSFSLNDSHGATYRALLAREYDMIWSGNYLKFSTVHPRATAYRFQPADSMVSFAEQNRMKVRGHTLVWHEQIPQWLSGGSWSGQQADSILRDHINTVMGRYQGRIGIWDVVNEALDDSEAMRSSFWLTKLGPGYVELAFRIAHAADPSALLFYNDYAIEGLSKKSNAVYSMIASLKAKGVPIHGIGFQGHLELGKLPSTSQMLTNFDRFAKLGLVIQITELDIRMPLPVTAQKLALQAQNYRQIVDVCLRTPACNAIEQASVYDGDSWAARNFPGEGAASLFDEAFRAKPAYSAVSDLLAAP